MALGHNEIDRQARDQDSEGQNAKVDGVHVMRKVRRISMVCRIS